MVKQNGTYNADTSADAFKNVSSAQFLAIGGTTVRLAANYNLNFNDRIRQQALQRSEQDDIHPRGVRSADFETKAGPGQSQKGREREARATRKTYGTSGGSDGGSARRGGRRRGSSSSSYLNLDRE